MRVQLAVPWNDAGTEHRAGTKLIDDGRARAVGVGIDEPPPPPPRSGKGSGVDVWAAYAGDVVVAARLDAAGLHIPEDATREDIWTALEAAGVPLEVEPAPHTDDDPGTAGDVN